MSTRPFSLNNLSLDTLNSVIEVAAFSSKVGSMKTNFMMRFQNPVDVSLKVIEVILLTVAFGEESEAKACWSAIAKPGPIDYVGIRYATIFPALKKRVDEISPEDRQLMKLNQVSTDTWRDNVKKLKTFAKCSKLLNEQEIRCIAWREPGMALFPKYVWETRPIYDLVLLVNPENHELATIKAQEFGRRHKPLVQVIKDVPGNAATLVWRDAEQMDVEGSQMLTMSLPDLFFQHFLSAKFETIDQMQWFIDCVQLLFAISSNEEKDTKQIIERINNSRNGLDVLQAWCLFLQIAEMTNYQVKDSTLTRALKSLDVSNAELITRVKPG